MGIDDGGDGNYILPQYLEEAITHKYAHEGYFVVMGELNWRKIAVAAHKYITGESEWNHCGSPISGLVNTSHLGIRTRLDELLSVAYTGMNKEDIPKDTSKLVELVMKAKMFDKNSQR